MSNTPETDAKQRLMYMDAVECVEIDFARKLERERDEARKTLREISKLEYITISSRCSM